MRLRRLRGCVFISRLAMSETPSSLPIEYKEILGRAPDAVIVHDMNDQVLYWSPKAEELYGWTAQEIEGRPVQRIFYIDAAAREGALAELMDRGAWAGELRQIDRQGHEHLVLSRQQLMRSNSGEPEAILSFNSDITEEKKRKDAEERAHHVRSSSILAGGIAHELNNALAPIMLSSAMLKRTVEEPKAKNMLSMIEKCATKGAELVSDLMAFERGRGGGKDSIRSTQIERSLKRVTDVLVADSVTLTTKLAEDLWEFRGEMSELAKVFKYVVENACEAMPNGGSLSIQISNRLFDANFESLAPEAKAGAYVEFVFTDTGFGIEKSLLNRVAEPFFTTKEPKQGFGFGLANSQAIVRGHKGFMVLESEQGTGTTLSIFLPADVPAERVIDSAPPFSFAEEGRGKLVLVADDELFIRETIKKTLEERGYEVITTQDGTEALAIYVRRSEEIDLVVTNVEMPFMDGPALCRALKKLKPDVRILVSSGHKQPEKMQELKVAGADDFLPKPYTAEVLADRVHAILTARD